MGFCLVDFRFLKLNLLHRHCVRFNLIRGQVYRRFFVDFVAAIVDKLLQYWIFPSKKTQRKMLDPQNASENPMKRIPIDASEAQRQATRQAAEVEGQRAAGQLASRAKGGTVEMMEMDGNWLLLLLLFFFGGWK